MTIEDQIVLARPVAIPLATYADHKDFAYEAAQSKMLGGMSGHDALLVLARGREIGLAPAAALTSVHVIKGRPTLSARAKYAACLSRRDICVYFVEIECTDELCVYETHRRGDPKPQRESFSISDAQRAGLASNENYRRFPKAMLRARCMAALADRVYADILLGLATTEEMEFEESRESREAPRSTPKSFDPAPFVHRFACAANDAELDAIASELSAHSIDDASNALLMDAYNAARARVAAMPEPEWVAHLASKTNPFEVGNALVKRAEAFVAAGVFEARAQVALDRIRALGESDPEAFMDRLVGKRLAA